MGADIHTSKVEGGRRQNCGGHYQEESGFQARLVEIETAAVLSNRARGWRPATGSPAKTSWSTAVGNTASGLIQAFTLMKGRDCRI
jgi:hypothetical protein